MPDRRFSRVSKVGVLWHSVVAGESRSLSNDETRCRGGLVEVEAPKLDSAIAFEKLWKMGDMDSREPAGGKGNDASIRLAGEANGDESNSNGDFDSREEQRLKERMDNWKREYYHVSACPAS